jgi:hypothetical protein
MARKSKIDMLAEAKLLQKEADEKLRAAVEGLKVYYGDRLQSLFGDEEADEALIILEKELKVVRKGERIDQLKRRLEASKTDRAVAPSKSPSEAPA